jgi:hypothetical protein
VVKSQAKRGASVAGIVSVTVVPDHVTLHLDPGGLICLVTSVGTIDTTVSAILFICAPLRSGKGRDPGRSPAKTLYWFGQDRHKADRPALSTLEGSWSMPS